jgi:nitrite reductase/ring-hydroxylating ferredoxin subunit
MMADPERKSIKPPNPATAGAAPTPSKPAEEQAAPKLVIPIPAAAAPTKPVEAQTALPPKASVPPGSKVKAASTAHESRPTGATPECDNRRGFFMKAAAIAIGAVITIFPFAAGLFFFLDPLRRGGAGLGFIRIAMLDAVPDDGVPRAFTVVADCVDAWTCIPSEPIGSVFLRREKGQAKPIAFQTTCPHAGCMIDYLAGERKFRCPCHNSTFQIDGRIIEPSPSPRPMDTLDCEVRDNRGVKEVWVKYENFITGTAQRIAKG